MSVLYMMLSWKCICLGRTTHGAGIGVRGVRAGYLPGPHPPRAAERGQCPRKLPHPTAHPDAATNHWVTDAEPSLSTFLLRIRKGSPTGKGLLNVSSVVLIIES